ncbi:MAG: DUF4411 family protein [Chthoniobacterales bacterium]
MNPPNLVYVIDSNVLIAAHRGYYGFLICPGFWECLLRQHQAGRVLSIDRVRAEIVEGDELSEWVDDSVPSSFFASTQNPTVAQTFAAIVQWVQGESQFNRPAKAEFARVADGWLAAYTQTRTDHVLVTLEVHNADAKSRVPLPNICRQFGVPYIDTFTMLRDLGASFVLGV